MPEGTDSTTVGTREPYATGWEHLSDELRRLDLLISCRLPEQGEVAASAIPLQEFKGLVLTEEEIRRLLGDPLDTSSSAMRIKTTMIRRRGNFKRPSSMCPPTFKRGAPRACRTGIYLPLSYLAQLFQLTAFEEQCLLVCLAPELDRKYEKLYAYLQDDVTRKKPSVDLVLKLLCETMPEKLAARLAFDRRALP